jgi:hypothetical protein
MNIVAVQHVALEIVTSTTTTKFNNTYKWNWIKILAISTMLLFRNSTRIKIRTNRITIKFSVYKNLKLCSPQMFKDVECKTLLWMYKNKKLQITVPLRNWLPNCVASISKDLDCWGQGMNPAWTVFGCYSVFCSHWREETFNMIFDLNGRECPQVRGISCSEFSVWI